MRHADLAAEACPVARASAVVGERWVWPILRAAFLGARRFEDFQRGTGAARTILTDRLARLVDDGVLTKTLPAGADSGHREYRLTDKGEALYPVFLALLQWGTEWTDLPAGTVAVEHTSCGHVIEPVVVCASCQEPLLRRDARARYWPIARTSGTPGR